MLEEVETTCTQATLNLLVNIWVVCGVELPQDGVEVNVGGMVVEVRGCGELNEIECVKGTNYTNLIPVTRLQTM